MLWSELERLGRFVDPWREFERMSRDLSRMGAPATHDFPLVNVWASADKAVVTTEAAGMNPEDIDISVADEVLSIKGKRLSDQPKDDETYHRRERWAVQFSKNIVLPFRIENSKVEAKYQKGVLTITLPRAEADKPKKIAIASE
ncbi:MAG: Hsp20/alpha crystallin family protein [Nitrospirota bacterium]|nr:Hsp20/alpha crystallin family protein [Nitrospirota bacterium]